MQTLLTLNAGSSSIKFALFTTAPLQLLMSGQIEGLGSDPAFRVRSPSGKRLMPQDGGGPDDMRDHAEALRWIIDWLRRQIPGLQMLAVGHRVVHGGSVFSAPMRIDDAVLSQLRELEPLAPLHQPHNLAGIAAAREQFGDVPQVACFDTAFHRTQGFVAETFALPRRWYDEGVRRYGFHGLSFEYIAQVLAERYPQQAGGRAVVAHLGNGASLCAIRQGRSMASTMGFTALDGLPMGTRCGQIDPGVLLYLMQHRGMDPRQLTDLLYHESGLKGLSGGLSQDMRALEASRRPEADQAIDYFVSRVQREVAAMAAVLGGMDLLVFTGGIGENSVRIRAQVLRGLKWLGISLDEERNVAGEERLSHPHSAVMALRLATDEETMIARHTVRAARLATVELGG